MYTTSLLEVIKTVAREKAFREYASMAMFAVSESNNIVSNRAIAKIREIMGNVEARSNELIDDIISDYKEKYIYPCYSLFINENKPKTINTVGETEDYLLIEFEVDKNIWFSIHKCKTLAEVVEEILNRGNLDDIQTLIVLEQGQVKDFIIEPCKNCYKPKVRWIEGF